MKMTVLANLSASVRVVTKAKRARKVTAKRWAPAGFFPGVRKLGGLEC